MRRWLRGIRSQSRSLAFCTIATRDFLPWAIVLFDSLRKHHPSAHLVLLYVRRDNEPSQLPDLEGVEVLATQALVDTETEATLRRRYTVPEFCFALKPRLLLHALDRGAERAIYLDSDIDVLAPLEEALISLEASSAVLTPHLDAPLPMDGKLPNEVTILRAGSCNLGFVGVTNSEEARRMLGWWDSRVARWGFVAPEAGYQGDQKWMDLAPSLFPGVALLRDPGSNVAGWNLHSRPVVLEGTQATVHGRPLAFFHFSGFDPDKPGVLSKYENRNRLADHPAVAALATGFARHIVAARARADALHWRELPGEVGPATAKATLAGGALDPAAYRAELLAQPVTGSYATGEEVVVPVTVRNASPEAWPVARAADGAGGIALSWHVRDTAGTVLAWENRRCYLPHDLAAGAALDMVVGVRAPPAPGRYVFEFDMVHEGHAWFAMHGSPTASLVVLVGLFDEPPEVRS
jgi:hypothetical protein